VNQWIAKCGWKDQGDGYVYVVNQEDNIKPKNITEKITFEGWLHFLNTTELVPQLNPFPYLKIENVKKSRTF